MRGYFEDTLGYGGGLGLVVCSILIIAGSYSSNNVPRSYDRVRA